MNVSRASKALNSQREAINSEPSESIDRYSPVVADFDKMFIEESLISYDDTVAKLEKVHFPITTEDYQRFQSFKDYVHDFEIDKRTEGTEGIGGS